MLSKNSHSYTLQYIYIYTCIYLELIIIRKWLKQLLNLILIFKNDPYGLNQEINSSQILGLKFCTPDACNIFKSFFSDAQIKQAKGLNKLLIWIALRIAIYSNYIIYAVVDLPSKAAAGFPSMIKIPVLASLFLLFVVCYLIMLHKCHSK